ncbi:MAG: hypothetical protein K9I85_16100 [Saprospiraceae bacterium]|nr:hypothetical protein [Saprospiraceae bacterium]
MEHPTPTSRITGMRSLKGILLVLLVMGSQVVRAQIEQSWFQLTLGASVNLHSNLGKRAFRNNFPGIKAFVGFASSNKLNLNRDKDFGLFNFSVNLSIYNKSLGNSLNLLYQDNQIDLTSSFSLGLMREAGPRYIRQMQTINNTPFYNLRHDGEYAFLVSTNFILNNHHRNQTVGALTLTAGRFSLNYYNDGGPPINNIGLGDGFDRWWTGGVGMYLHDQGEYNVAELYFDQFTGYEKLMFELGGIFGMDIQDYDIFHSFQNASGETGTYNLIQPSNFGYNYNSSTYSVRYFFSPQFGMQVGVIGSLRNPEKETFYALQDLIHLLKRDPLHPNKDVNRLFYGITYYQPYEIR